MYGGGLHHFIDDGILGIDTKISLQFLICHYVYAGTYRAAEVKGYPVRFLVAECL
jgi:hypothetical protein